MAKLQRPVVLTLSGHDPTGGAGLQADIETIGNLGCHAVNVITVLTEQDTHNVKSISPQAAETITRQAETLLADVPIQAIKIGLLADIDVLIAVRKILQANLTIPVIVDPILAAGGGKALTTETFTSEFVQQLLPYTTVLTPNSKEARQLTGLYDLNACGLSLLELGCDYVLITGTHEDTAAVENLCFHQGSLIETFKYARLPYSYHGSGCTLASAIAAFIALGFEPMQALVKAQDYTWQTLVNGFQAGQGQHLPNRFFQDKS
jgi:hydroxymethylpyrimidine/phosphomethylpyrimidine kinase